MTPDMINGMYEVLGGCFLLLSVRRLHVDKIVRGVSIVAVSFFASWGLWNLYFYPHLNQWFSFYGGLFTVSVNLFWVGQMLYYRRRECRNEGVEA